MSQRAGLLVLLAAASYGCSQGAPATPLTLAECVTGFYVVPPSESCAVACAGSSKLAECSQSDCALWDFRGYLSGGLYVGGLITYSKQAATMSTSSPSYRGTYGLIQDSMMLAVDPPAQQLHVTGCTSARFLANQIAQEKAPADLAKALQSATSSGALTWSAAPVSQ